MGYRFEKDPEISKALQTQARYQMMCRLEQDILMDMHVCEVEGWDKTEFIRMLYDLVNRWMEKIKETEEPKK